jgi:CRP-like cAMP-binding protein
LIKRLLWLMQRERRFLDLKLTTIGQCSAEERIATALLHLYERLQQIGLVRDDTFTLPLTQQHLADVLGLHVIHINRVLRRLRQKRLITTIGRDIRLNDMVSLREMVPLRHLCGDDGLHL